MMTPVDPVVYFQENNLGESDALSIQWSESTGTLEFVIRFVDIENLLPVVFAVKDGIQLPRPAWNAEFRHLVFEGVRNLRRKSAGRFGDLATIGDGISLPGIHRGNHALHPGGTKIRAMRDGYEVRISVSELGVYRFRFRSMAVSQRFGKVERPPSEVEHWSDFYTGQPFEYSRPFETPRDPKNDGGMIEVAPPKGQPCVVCGERIPTPEEFVGWGHLAEDASDPLHRYNFAYFHVACLPRWLDLDVMVQHLQHIGDSGVWIGPGFRSLADTLREALDARTYEHPGRGLNSGQ